MSAKRSTEFYGDTEKLIQIASKHGMRQTTIASLCNVSQSTVSKWKSGELPAKRKDIAPLLKKFGEHLRRTPFKLYQTTATQEEPRKFVRVEGKLILREKFRGVHKENVTPTLRVSIHRQGADQFAFVIESTIATYPERNKTTGPMPLITDRLAAWFLDGTIDQAVWVADMDKLRDLALRLASGDNAKLFPSLGQLPYLVAEALLNHGYKLDDLVEFKLAE